MERDTGFLTNGQRKYLTGEKDLDEHPNKWEFKKRVRKRISGSFDDLELLRQSPYWTDEDFAKVARETRQPNTGILEPMDDNTVEQHLDGVKSQSKIYGDAVHNMAEDIEEIELEGDWDDTEEQVQEIFVQHITDVMTDVLNVVTEGDITDDVTEEFFEDVWPDRDRALEIVQRELSNG